MHRLSIWGTNAAIVLAASLAASVALAEVGWVQGAPLNLRSGAGNQYRILGAIKPGERLEVLKRVDGWTQVKLPDGKKGWISAGFLDPVAPPTVRLEKLEAETIRLQAELEAATSESERMRTSTEEIVGRDEEQRNDIDRLRIENTRLRAGVRWAEWMTGALIFSTGMALGAIVRGLSGRNRSSRLRL